MYEVAQQAAKNGVVAVSRQPRMGEVVHVLILALQCETLCVGGLEMASP